MLEISGSLSAEEIGSIESLEALEPEWRSLWQRCPSATPFQNPIWLIPWWRYFGSDKQLLTLLFRTRGDLVGVAPFCILHDHEGCKVMPVGIGVSDYLDALFAPGYEQAGAEACINHLLHSTTHWDICELQPLLAESPFLKTEVPGGMIADVRQTDQLTSLKLPSEPRAFRSQLSSHFTKRLNKAYRQAHLLGSVRFETGMPFHKTFDQLLRFHEARWSNRSNTGALMRRADAFHREAAQAMLHHGTLRLYGLNIGGQIVAVLYGFRHRRRGYFYLMGFDAAFSKISPGVLLMIYAIEELIREEAISCEFLRGHEPFKYRWGVSERNTYGLRIHHRT